MNYSTGSQLKDNKRAKHELLKQSSLASYPFLIKITFKDETYRYVKYFEDVTFNKEVYTASNFIFTPPEESTEGIKDAHLSLSDVDQSWTERVRKLSTFDKIVVEFVAVVVYDKGTNSAEISEIETIIFTVKNVRGNGITMEADLTFDEITNVNIPCDVMDSTKCAGCS